MCKIFNTIGENNECLLEQSELAGKWFQILSMFSMGVVATMLVWTKSAVQSWKNLFSSFFGKEIKEENKLVLFIDFDALDAEVQRLEMKEKSDDPEKQQLETKN
ncbi:protein smoothened-like [Cotesia glomerata]|nr:protein smoothened-like [Cotesia glomerata]